MNVMGVRIFTIHLTTSMEMHEIAHIINARPFMNYTRGEIMVKAVIPT